MPNLKIVFAGTPEFAVPSLAALIAAGHEVVAVYTQPDRAAGRGQKLQVSPIKQFAERHSIPVEQPQTLKDETVQEQLAAYGADVIVVAAYGLIFPQAILDIPRLGCLNVHASWLPRWRGAAPIQHAILAGDTETGISIMQMAEGLDTGDVLCLQGCSIADTETTQSLHDKLAVLGGEAIVETLQQITDGTAVHTPQEESLVTYAKKITKQQAQLDWEKSALELHRMVRAYNPYPVAYTSIDERLVKIWKVIPIAVQAEIAPGTIVEISGDAINVACAKGILQIQEIQWPNRNRQTIKEALNANNHPFVVGKRFE